MITYLKKHLYGVSERCISNHVYQHDLRQLLRLAKYQVKMELPIRLLSYETRAESQGSSFFLVCMQSLDFPSSLTKEVVIESLVL